MWDKWAEEVGASGRQACYSSEAWAFGRGIDEGAVEPKPSFSVWRDWTSRQSQSHACVTYPVRGRTSQLTTKGFFYYPMETPMFVSLFLVGWLSYCLLFLLMTLTGFSWPSWKGHLDTIPLNLWSLVKIWQAVLSCRRDFCQLRWGPHLNLMMISKSLLKNNDITLGEKRWFSVFLSPVLLLKMLTW